MSTADKGASDITEARAARRSNLCFARAGRRPSAASISLIQPVDLYSRVNRATKYGFLFIGFTFVTLLMFDVIGGVRVSAVEYLLMGAAIVLFFVLLLAFAEVIGFTAAYVVASVAIAGLNTAYSAAVLGSWKRGYVIGALLIGLYAVLYILLGLEAFSLLIGSVLLFVALAGVMYATRAHRLERHGAPRRRRIGAGRGERLPLSRSPLMTDPISPKAHLPLLQGRCAGGQACAVVAADRGSRLPAGVPGQ